MPRWTPTGGEYLFGALSVAGRGGTPASFLWSNVGVSFISARVRPGVPAKEESSYVVEPGSVQDCRFPGAQARPQPGSPLERPIPAFRRQDPRANPQLGAGF